MIIYEQNKQDDMNWLYLEDGNKSACSISEITYCNVCLSFPYSCLINLGSRQILQYIPYANTYYISTSVRGLSEGIDGDGNSYTFFSYLTGYQKVYNIEITPFNFSKYSNYFESGKIYLSSCGRCGSQAFEINIFDCSTCCFYSLYSIACNCDSGWSLTKYINHNIYYDSDNCCFKYYNNLGNTSSIDVTGLNLNNLYVGHLNFVERNNGMKSYYCMTSSMYSNPSNKALEKMFKF